MSLCLGRRRWDRSNYKVTTSNRIDDRPCAVAASNRIDHDGINPLHHCTGYAAGNRIDVFSDPALAHDGVRVCDFDRDFKRRDSTPGLGQRMNQSGDGCRLACAGSARNENQAPPPDPVGDLIRNAKPIHRNGLGYE
jgi:hypothetical protein